ncbi:MAG: hypothetical protein U9R38_00155 [Candidatus Margulisiibacteriota bacterium]|nr:hypothetical protein [Candidatus Margulisiibacteriota bacterium]
MNNLNKKNIEELLREHFRKIKSIELKINEAGKSFNTNDIKKIADQAAKESKGKSDLEKECIRVLGEKRFIEIHEEILGE